jgi:hypothetical protein
MARPVKSPRLPTSPQSFAEMLTTLASPARAETNPEPEWSSGDRDEDGPHLDEALTKRSGDAGADHHEIRSVSVTVRLSKAECARLHERAAEAGVTVSAYMRSCTFKGEAPRPQVKETLAELKSATSKENAARTARKPRSWFGPLARLFPHRNSPGQAF